MKSVAAVVLVLSLAGCNGGPATDDQYFLAAAALCDASTNAQRGDFDQARQAFYDTAHRSLHDLAAEVTEVDRVLAGHLLEAKESVESGFDNDGAGLAESLQALVEAADAALMATGHDSMPCTTEDY